MKVKVNKVNHQKITNNNIKVKTKENEPEIFQIGSEFICLDSLLKFVGAVSTGGQAKIVIQNNEVKVNGEVCDKRGKRLHNGDRVEYQGKIYEVNTQ